MWCGFPSWEETASCLLKNYRRLEARFDKGKGRVARALQLNFGWPVLAAFQGRGS
jgi:hypothetical protein